MLALKLNAFPLPAYVRFRSFYKMMKKTSKTWKEWRGSNCQTWKLWI